MDEHRSSREAARAHYDGHMYVFVIALVTVSYQSIKAALADLVKGLRYE